MPDDLHAGFATPLGPLTATIRDGAIAALDWRAGPRLNDALVAKAQTQLDAYFDCTLEVFDLPLAPRASDFQAAFYAVLRSIPYGETREYGDIAREMGVPAQAIGQACGGNPIPILIPCHRVLSATGLGGFSAKGGVETKVALLKLERAASLLI